MKEVKYVGCFGSRGCWYGSGLYAVCCHPVWLEEEGMSVTYANHYDAAKLLSGMTEEQKERLRREIPVRKLACTILERPYNRDLLRFVERRLNSR